MRKPVIFKKISASVKRDANLKDKILSLMILIALVVAMSLALYPTFSDAVAGATQNTTITSYADMLSDIDASKLRKVKKDAIAYNRTIQQKQKTIPFVYTGTGDGDKAYQKIMNIGGDGVMGYIEIPKIGVSIPIGHGTDDDVLESGAGHVHGTSVPIGGTGTHSVISAHTGLQSAKLFTDIDKLKLGDRFSIHVLNEVHYYKVIKTRIELPREANRYLQVEDGKDLVTLYTCTPYGINTHRLLVTAQADGVKTVKKMKEEELRLKRRKQMMLAKAILLGSIPVIILIFGAYRIFGNHRNSASKAGREDEAGEKKHSS